MDTVGWTADRNGDGFVDDIAPRLVINPPRGMVDRDFCARLIDLAARLGLETHALTLPFAVVAGMARTDDRPDLTVATAGDLPVLPAPTALGDERIGNLGEPSSCLTDLFTIRGALADTDGDLLPDMTRLTFDLPVEMPASFAAALANFAARVGLETGGVTLPLAREGGSRFVVRPGMGPSRLTAKDGGWLAEGDAIELANLLDRVAGEWPHLAAPECGGVGQSLARLRRWLAGDGPEPNDPGAVVWEREWEADWEVDGAVAAIAELPNDALDGRRLVVFASEPPDIRRELEERLVADLGSRGIDIDIVVLSAFKAGLSWLREVVTPALVALPTPPARVQIAYRRMAEVNTLDMPIRWLQELFPGPELMAAELGIDPGAIEMVEAGDDTPATFVADAFDAEGASLGRWTCTPPWRAQPFVPALGDEPGRVVVTTGGVMAADGDSWRELARVPTDLETFWEFWQGVVVPDLLRLVEEAGARAVSQPFFGELLAEVWVSEPNERLGVREENDSAAEALAEDIYFTTLDAIELFGQRQTGDTLSAPGAIVPIVRVSPGAAPRARVTLRAAPSRPSLPYPDLRVAELRLDGNHLAMSIVATVDGDPAATLARLQQLATMELTDGRDLIAARVVLNDTTVDLTLSLTSPLVSGPSSPGPRPSMTANLHGDAIVEMAESLAAAPEVTAWIEDWSYQSRPIPALSLAAPCEGRLRSPLKAAILKPTYLIVARHHANEISSTNAAFQLAWLCANEPHWRRYLDAVNIVILPYENPDGAALHAMLASFPESQTWKHHPARYNALGFEYGADHLNPDSRFGEARARGSLWRRWLPDVVVDNHGVPSHEWVQPFAGYGSPPRFRVSYWIVQALLYGIASYLDDPDAPEQRASVDALRDAVSAKVRDSDIGDWNRVYGASYRAWGQSREPERFPGAFHDDMLWHVAALEPGSPYRGFHLLYPRTTALSWITEVNDETAEGEHLERVARAHLLAHEATLDLLVAAASPPEARAIDHGDGATTWRIGRQRPLLVRG